MTIRIEVGKSPFAPECMWNSEKSRSYINQTVINLNCKAGRVQKVHCKATINQRLFILVI